MSKVLQIIPAENTWAKYKDTEGKFFYWKIVCYALIHDNDINGHYIAPMEMSTDDATIDELDITQNNFVEIVYSSADLSCVNRVD